MHCRWCYRVQVLTILSLGDGSVPELVDENNSGREILVVLHKKKRLWIGGRSDQQGMAGNLRPKTSLEESTVDRCLLASLL
jgi:hypothetical protein